MPVTTNPNDTKIRVYQSADALRSGGETRPLDYPHLYQIQAGEWRISYAVEHNRLAILVLEVLNPDGTVRTDPAREKITRKMKVKLLDWPEGSPSRDLPPEELGKKLKIKLLDLADDFKEGSAQSRPSKSRIKFSTSAVARPRGSRITLLDSSESEKEEDDQEASTGGNELQAERRVTPLDSPTL